MMQLILLEMRALYGEPLMATAAGLGHAQTAEPSAAQVRNFVLMFDRPGLSVLTESELQAAHNSWLCRVQTLRKIVSLVISWVRYVHAQREKQACLCYAMLMQQAFSFAGAACRQPTCSDSPASGQQ